MFFHDREDIHLQIILLMLQGLIYRFKFLMLGTILCAAITVIFFIISQVSEGHWKWGEENTLEYTSAFFTGTDNQSWHSIIHPIYFHVYE